MQICIPICPTSSLKRFCCTNLKHSQLLPSSIRFMHQTSNFHAMSYALLFQAIEFSSSRLAAHLHNSFSDRPSFSLLVQIVNQGKTGNQLNLDVDDLTVTSKAKLINNAKNLFTVRQLLRQDKILHQLVLLLSFTVSHSQVSRNLDRFLS